MLGDVKASLPALNQHNLSRFFSTDFSNCVAYSLW